MKNSNKNGFSLIEALATVAIIGIITFLALPNVVSARRDAEASMAVARAEAVNMAVSSFVQSRGYTTAKAEWDGAADEDKRYDALKNYLAYSPNTITEFSPDGWKIELPLDVIDRPLKKVDLFTVEIVGGTEVKTAVFY